MTVDTTNGHFYRLSDVTLSAAGNHRSTRYASANQPAVGQRFISNDQIRHLSRDLRMLIATNGTLTRILSVVKDDDIDVDIIDQRIHRTVDISSPEDSSPGRILQRNVILKGRRSGKLFVAAESSIAIDLLPPAITSSLMRTNRPIGELIVGSCLENFKETPEVWMGEQPGWAVAAWHRNSPAKAVGRRYRVLIKGRPAIITTEYFPLHVFPDQSAA